MNENIITEETENKLPDYNKRFERESWFKKLGRAITPHQPAFNMPKTQPCPTCHAESKRVGLYATGGVYHCRNHSDFLVQHPKLVIKPKGKYKK